MNMSYVVWRRYKICIDKADVFIDAIFSSKFGIIAVLYGCMFKILMILKLLLIFVSTF